MSDLLLGALIGFSGILATVVVGFWNTGRANTTSMRNALLADGTVRENAARADSTTRALKLTDHRVAWLQRLRDEMAMFQSWGMTPNLDQANQREFYEHGTRIELLMNNQDPDYEELQKLMYGLLSATQITAKFSLNAEYVVVCQRILKREWDVAKRELQEGISDPEQAVFSRAKPR